MYHISVVTHTSATSTLDSEVQTVVALRSWSFHVFQSIVKFKTMKVTQLWEITVFVEVSMPRKVN